MVRYFEGAVRAAIVDDYELPVEVAVWDVVRCRLLESDWGRKYTYCSVKVFAISHVMMGRFLRSLYVGRRIEYLSFDFGAILTDDFE